MLVLLEYRQKAKALCGSSHTDSPSFGSLKSFWSLWPLTLGKIKGPMISAIMESQTELWNGPLKQNLLLNTEYRGISRLSLHWNSVFQEKEEHLSGENIPRGSRPPPKRCKHVEKGHRKHEVGKKIYQTRHLPHNAELSSFQTPSTHHWLANVSLIAYILFTTF